jgi:hypothetical protein
LPAAADALTLAAPAYERRRAKKKQGRKPKGHAGDTADTADWSGPPETIRARRRIDPLTWP